MIDLIQEKEKKLAKDIFSELQTYYYDNYDEEREILKKENLLNGQKLDLNSIPQSNN